MDYSRQKGLIDEKKLMDKRILIVGVGGIGCVVSEYLVRAGINHLLIVDPDVVSLTDLNRQTLYKMSDVGKNKVLAAKDYLEKIREGVLVDARITIFDDGLLGGIDLVFDCVDNYDVKLEINKACFSHKIPVIFGSAKGFEGMVSLFVPGKTGCLGCLSKKAEGSGLIVGPVAGMIGCLQAVEGLKYLNNNGDLLMNKLLHVDCANNEYGVMNFSKKKGCDVCGNV